MDKSFVLAEMSTERYVWYPTAKSDTIHIIIDMIRPLFRSVTIYNIGDEMHKIDYEHWKTALMNRTKTFARKGMIFHQDNIDRLESRGYIVFFRK